MHKWLCLLPDCEQGKHRGLLCSPLCLPGTALSQHSMLTPPILQTYVESLLCADTSKCQHFIEAWDCLSLKWIWRQGNEAQRRCLQKLPKAWEGKTLGIDSNSPDTLFFQGSGFPLGWNNRRFNVVRRLEKMWMSVLVINGFSAQALGFQASLSWWLRTGTQSTPNLQCGWCDYCLSLC